MRASEAFLCHIIFPPHKAGSIPEQVAPMTHDLLSHQYIQYRTSTVKTNTSVNTVTLIKYVLCDTDLLGSGGVSGLSLTRPLPLLPWGWRWFTFWSHVNFPQTNEQTLTQ